MFTLVSKKLHRNTSEASAGFTLVELMITVSIILLMSTIALARFVSPNPQTEFDQGMKQMVSQMQLMRTYAKSVRQCCSDAELSRPPYPDLGYAMKFYLPTEDSPDANHEYMFFADSNTPEETINRDEGQNDNNEGGQQGDEDGPALFAYQPEGFDEMIYEGPLPAPLEFDDCSFLGFNLSDFYEADFVAPECQVYMFRRPEEGFALNDFGGGPPYIDVIFQHKNEPSIKGTVRIFNNVNSIEYIAGVAEPPFDVEGISIEDVFSQ